MRRLIRSAALLVLPLAVLLFAQWPLREWIQAGSREANDLGQVLFAFYCAVGVTAATRAGTHLCAGHGIHAGRGRWRPWALLACIGPWAVFLLVTTAPVVWASLVSLERFPETFNPGYFLLKLALWLLGALALGQAVVDAWRARHA